MKSTFRFTIAATALFSAAALMSAAPRSKSQAPNPHSGRPAAAGLVCAQCQPSMGGADAMKQCVAGGKLTCSSCKTKFTLAAHGRPANRLAGRQVTYVNGRGDACVFVAVAAGTP